MSLITLIYGSAAVDTFTEPELVALLEKSRANNQPLGITGMLVYRDGNFLQVLEGEAEQVDALFAKISRDPRHRGILIFLRRALQQREFSDWSMGFVNLDTVNAEQIPGYSTYLNTPLTSAEFEQEGFAFTFLRVFKQMMVR